MVLAVKCPFKSKSNAGEECGKTAYKKNSSDSLVGDIEECFDERKQWLR